MTKAAFPSRAGQAALDTGRVGLRPATLHDLDGIMAIEQISFSAPWPRTAFAEEIEGRSWSRVIVAEENDRVVGFIVYWIITTELHLLNLAIDPQWRRRGIASSLVEHLVERGRKERRTEILLEVRITNRSARDLYHRFGFRKLAVRPGYYTDNGEDALVMSLRLGNFEVEQLPNRA